MKALVNATKSILTVSSDSGRGFVVATERECYVITAVALSGEDLDIAAAIVIEILDAPIAGFSPVLKDCDGVHSDHHASIAEVGHFAGITVEPTIRSMASCCRASPNVMVRLISVCLRLCDLDDLAKRRRTLFGPSSPDHQYASPFGAASPARAC
jgi:hypothetical protein